MKTKKRKIASLSLLFLLAMIFTWNSCSKEEISATKKNEINEIKYRNFNPNNSGYEQNFNFNNLAIVVSEALKDNINFRIMVRNESLLKFDGDYDILLNDFKDSTISVGSGNFLIKQFLDNYYRQLNLTVFPSNKGYSNEIDHLTDLYPKIQISVPIHADTWDDSYNPIVTFIPDDYNEGETDFVIAYQDSTLMLLDAVTPPNDPVIVIGNNERVSYSELDGYTYPYDTIPEEPPVLNILLTASAYQSGIKLSWTFSSHLNPILGYHIYRKGNGTNNFSHIGDSDGYDNTVYEDNTTEKLTSYSYFVKAYNAFGVSSKSNTVTITSPDGPAPVENFDAVHLAYEDIELRWYTKQGQYIDHTDIYKRVIGVDNQYNLLGSFDPNEHHYIDNNVFHGKRVNYMAQEVIDDLGNSNEKYDFVVVPYRDISQHTPVYITYIHFPCKYHDDIEGYLLGEPEFRVSIVKGTSKETTQVIQEEVKCDFSSNFPFQNCWEWPRKKVNEWLPSNWMEIYTFKVWEYDNVPNADLEINVGYNKKDTTKNNFINGNIKVTMKDLFNSADEKIGTAQLYYTDRKSTTLKFPNYEVEMYIETQP